MIQLHFGSAAFVARDLEGCFIGSGFVSFPCVSSFSAEAIAIKLATDFTLTLPLSSILIESNCKVLVDAIKGVPSFLELDSSDTISHITWLASFLDLLSITFVPGTANNVAH